MIELLQLRERIKDYIGGKRLSHTYAVEEEAAVLAELFGITGADRLRLQYAALLHDITFHYICLTLNIHRFPSYFFPYCLPA